MAGPTTTVEFGFGSTWKTLDSAITWTDVTAYVLLPERLNSNRGRQNELDDFAAGRCAFTLNNTTRRFDPDYSAGAYYGNLKPGVPVRIRSTANAVTSDVFRGFVHGWPQRYDVSNRMGTVPIEASDGFRMLARATLTQSAYSDAVEADSPTGYWRLGERVTSTTFTDEIAARTATLSGYAKAGEQGALFGDSNSGLDLTGYTAFLDVDGSFGVSGGNFTHEGWGTFPNPTASLFNVLVIQFDVTGVKRTMIGAYEGSAGAGTWRAFMYSTPDAAVTSDILYSADYPVDRDFHYIGGAFAGTAWTLVVDGHVTTKTASVTVNQPADGFVRICGTTGGTRGEGLWDGTIDEIAYYPTNLTSTQLIAHYNAGHAPWDGDTSDDRIIRVLDAIAWPSDLRAISAGDTTLGPVSVDGAKTLSFLKNIELSEQGKLFVNRSGDLTFLNRYWALTDTHGTTSQVTLSDDGADTPYSDLGYDYDDEHIVNKATGARQGGSPISCSDQTSIDTYGEMVDTELSSLQLQSDAFVLSALQYRVDRYKDPVKRLPAIRVPLHRLTAAQQSALLGLELGYRVTVQRTPQAVGSQYSADALIEGITHDIATANGIGEHWMTFQLSPVDTRSYWILGTSQLGTDTRLGF